MKDSDKPCNFDICDGVSMHTPLTNKQYDKMKLAEKQAQSNNTSKRQS
jgi:hypothetical protein